MTKILNIIKILLLIILIILNFIFWNKIDYNEFGPFMFFVFGTIYIILYLKDIIKKNNILSNKNYNIISIIVLLIINIIFIRALTDNHFLFNNISYQKEIDNYTNSQYGFTGGYDDSFEMFNYMNQNMKYFILMIILLLTYRKINITKKTS